MATKPKDIEEASEILGKPVETGIWCTRFRHRWYHEGTGTELDLLMLPVVIWYLVFKRNPKQETGPVFVVLSENELVFFAGSDGIFRRHITHVSERRSLDDVVNIIFDNSNQTSLRFMCKESAEILLYYSGSQLELERFVSLST